MRLSSNLIFKVCFCIMSDETGMKIRRLIMLARQPYPNDLSDQEWNLIAPLVTFKRTPRGRKGIHSKREMLRNVIEITSNFVAISCLWV